MEILGDIIAKLAIEPIAFVVQNGQRKMENSKIRLQCMDLIPEDYFLTNVLISVIYQKKKCRVKYMPITFRPRQGGVNSINMKRIQKIGRQAWHDFRVIRKSIDR